MILPGEKRPIYYSPHPTPLSNFFLEQWNCYLLARFNPIENLFGHVKRTLQDFEFEKRLKLRGMEKTVALSKAVIDVMFQQEKY